MLRRKLQIRRLKEQEKSSFVALMAESFTEDPLFLYLFREAICPSCPCIISL